MRTRPRSCVRTTIVSVITSFLMFPVSGLAQVFVQVVSFPSAGEVQTNRHAQTAEPSVVGAGILISGALIADSPLTTTTLRIAFPAPITSAPASFVTGTIPPTDPIRVEGATGVFATVSEAVLNTTFSRIEITLPGFTNATNTQSGSFRLVGVRIDANGKTGAQTAIPSLNNLANNYILTTSSLTVINAITPGIASFAIGSRLGQPNRGTATILTNRTVSDAVGSFTLTEGFASAFRTALQSSNSGSPVANGTNIRLTFNNVPVGVTLNLTANTASGFNATLNNSSITATTNTTFVSFTATDLTSVETLEIDYTVVTPLSTAAALTRGTITVTATLVPTGDGLNNDDPTRLGLPRYDQGYPTFAASEIGPITVVEIARKVPGQLITY